MKETIEYLVTNYDAVMTAAAGAIFFWWFFGFPAPWKILASHEKLDDLAEKIEELTFEAARCAFALERIADAQETMAGIHDVEDEDE